MPVPTRMMMAIMLRPVRGRAGCVGGGGQRGWPGGVALRIQCGGSINA